MNVHKGGEGGPAHVDACEQGEGDQKRDFFVDVINGWPLRRCLHVYHSNCIPPWISSSQHCHSLNSEALPYNCIPHGFHHANTALHNWYKRKVALLAVTRYPQIVLTCTWTYVSLVAYIRLHVHTSLNRMHSETLPYNN